MKKLLLTFAMMLLLVTVVILVSCGEAASTSETTPAETTPEAPAVTTEELTANGIPVDKLSDRVSALVGEKKFDEEALALMKLIIRDYYDKKGNRVLDANGNTITLWGVGAFLEAVAAVHKLYPEDEEILSVYEGLLDRGLKSYKVRYSPKKVNGVIPYYYNASAGNSGDYYYDDDEWIAIQYLEAYKALGKESYLQYAQEILEFIWQGWGLQSNDTLENGGIPWHCNGQGPTTCSNAPAAYAFLQFSRLTDDGTLSNEYIERAKTVYDWTRKHLSNGSTYIDSHNAVTNERNNWSASYNNGVMLANSSLLYAITGEKTYLTHAKNTARGAFSVNTKIEDGRPEFENDIENPWMNGWLVRGWIEYYKVDTTNSVGYLNRCAEIMAFAIDNKLAEGRWAGYLRVQLDELPTKTWQEGSGADRVTVKNDHPSNDAVNLGGGVTMIAILADWAALYGEKYQ